MSTKYAIVSAKEGFEKYTDKVYCMIKESFTTGNKLLKNNN